MTDLEAVRSALDGAGLALVETITNPLCSLPDVEAIASMARDRGVPVLVDNTFASPILFRPLEVGATAVMHSATEYVRAHPAPLPGAPAPPADALSAHP